MAAKPNHRTPFLEAADARPATRWQRLVRFLFRQRPLNVSPMTAQAVEDPRVFVPSEEGSGNFGRWIVDSDGLPAYQYEIDQYKDPRAYYPNSEGIDRRDHWHQVGNYRITALVSNDGTVQVYIGDRGGTFLNRYEAWEYNGLSILLLLIRAGRAVLRFVTRVFSGGSQVIKSLAGAPSQPPSAESPAAAPGKTIPPRGIVSLEALSAARESSQDVISAQAAAAITKPQNRRSLPPTPFAYAGGYSYVDNGAEVWATAFRYRPKRAQTRRVFGIGYFETETVYQNVRVHRKVYAPHGNDPVLLADVQIENLGAMPLELRHYEYWDVNVHQLRLEWLRTGGFGVLNDDERRKLNRYFTSHVDWQEDCSALRFKQELKQPLPPQVVPPDAPSDIDWYPAHVFLADLSGKPDAFYVDKQRFFGTGGARCPDAVRQHQPGNQLPLDLSGDFIPYCMVLRHDVHLQPGERCRLRYAYGIVQPGETLSFLDPYRQPSEPAQNTVTRWKDDLVYFSTGEDPVLHREMAWHTYNLLSATVYNAFHKTYLVPQGSSYLYLHGADGAPRDQALFVLPLTYINPELARDMLRLIMRITDAATGQIPYAFAGYGFISDGMGIHTRPSDLDLFFLLALSEYLAATGDLHFLAEEVPFYPPNSAPQGTGITVLDHVRVALKHLFEEIGVGENGLIKVGSGDWSDSIVLETSLQDGPGPFGVTYNNSKQQGESVPNTQMALYVLPLLAEIIRPCDSQLADYIYDAPSQPNRIERLRVAVMRQWNEKGWYNRAILRGFSNQPIVLDHFNLEAQVWALISGLPAAANEEAALIAEIEQFLDDPSPIGAALVQGGMVWPAISQLLTWAYVRRQRPRLAWRSLNRTTFAMHAHIYPNIWFNTWSGPDGINGTTADLPGGTWTSPITPMTDFPVMNANQDALALLGLLRTCGVEPAIRGDGLRICPGVPRERFTLQTPLLQIEVTPTAIRGQYRAGTTGTRALYIAIPDAGTNVAARMDGQSVSVLERAGNEVRLLLSFSKDQIIKFEVVWTL
jgi:hypothetical protein